MAPVTRRSLQTGTTKNVSRKALSGYSENATAPSSVMSLGETSGTSALVDLRDVAERVGREVDIFAETLDQFNDRLRGPDVYQAVHSLCLAYRDHGGDMVKRLRKQYHMHQMQHTRNSFSKRAQQSSRFETRQHRADSAGSDSADLELQDLRRWEVERDTWELFRIMLEVRYTPAENDEASQDLESAHRYESHDDAFERFLASDKSAKERFAVLKWLEGSADDAAKDNADSSNLQKGAVLRKDGWMETRENIKGAKRLQFGQEATLDLRRSGDNDLLVSELDPDAPSRQHRALEKADALSEREIWIACWGMLRRGTSWSEICKWCADRRQSWRAVSMGVAADSENKTRGGGPTAGALWRNMCLLAARSKTASEYEAAVYGLLGGDLVTVQQVCCTWDDHVYAQFNNLFVQQHNAYVLKHNGFRLPADFIKKAGLAAKPSQASDEQILIRKLFQRLQQSANTAAEAQRPIKMLQAGLLQDTFVDFCIKVSSAASVAADSSWEEAVLRQPEVLRIMTHMLLLLKKTYSAAKTSEAVAAADTIIAAYIQRLRVAGKRDLAPIYASMMTPSHGVASLAEVLSDIHDGKESIEFVKLMEIYRIDAIAVLNGQYKFLLQPLVDSATSFRFSILETTKEEMFPGQKTKLGFLDAPLDHDEEALVRSLEVFYSIEGHWAVTFRALADACRKLLVKGRFRAACALVDRMQYETLSLNKSSTILGQHLDVMDDDKVAVFALDESRSMQIEILQKESKAYYDMSLIVRAIEALANWRQVEHEYASKVPRPTFVPSKVKKAFEETVEAMEPILSGVLDAKEFDDDHDYATIRNMYLPEIILAYNTVLSTAGHMISRDELLRSMDLATVLAGEQNSVGQAFIKARRMGELLQSFAETSRIMLKLNETGKARKEKKSWMGRSLGIWEING